MRATENEKRDWSVIALILLLGLLAILLAGRWALRFAPRWELDASAESRLDPNSEFLTHKPDGFIEPVDPAILTNPAWIDSFLTPGASLSTITPLPTTADASFTTPTSGTLVTTLTATPATTTALATNTALASPTNTFVYFPPPPSSTPKSNPGPTSTSVIASPTPTSTSAGVATFTSTPTASVTPSQTFTATTTSTPTATPTSTSTPTSINTPTNTPTSIATDTPTNTPTSTTPPFCTTTIIIGTSGSYAKPGGSTCFEYTDSFANGGIFQITSPVGTGVNGTVDGSSCPGTSISSGSTINYGVTQSVGLMMFRITGTAGIVDINISDWTTYPTCP